ncbi:AMP-binding protein [Actinophytocola algeriensis]|uniref:Acyl-CoA synthetase (AMP-forming)/AMP-acid ligase II n=1 Tax=Actinophytocola algeriensis TaxID=1768010 RepID=A0A7W7VJM1_9PSEU|nr:AMP-binding protein [Actinophytocola algeriensis]MBB4912240.1 acyl-CoA synthetase (AMP-forming)/AMP-acid ligase II [Actinophytocola algeriensis]MBE1474244.1 acyl-CoA synthetase (AMP-forming)/AMP-acid ligase II [Actinophytocola algeriensis]
MNLATLSHRNARRTPDRLAIAQGGLRVTYSELSDRVARLAGLLHARGVRPGDRVGILQHNGIALLESLLACFHGGFAAVPVNARSTPHEVGVIAEDSAAAAWLITAEYAGHVDGAVLDGQPPDVEPLPQHDSRADDPAWIFYTSGTTGRPKGAVLSHRNLAAMVLAYLADVRDLDGSATVLHAAPLTHGSGLYALPAIAKGATQLITASRSYDPAEVLGIVETERVTDIAFLAPTMVNRLVRAQQEYPRDTTSLVNVVYGGAPMYPTDIARALEVFGPVFSQIYGQAEAPVTITTLHRTEHSAERYGTVGHAYTSVEVGVRDGDTVTDYGDGEIVVRGDVVMTGYWRNPDATAKSIVDGWLRTGDIGRISADGTVRLLDRDKDVVISGGANIYPREVEEVILTHPDVREVAVVGAPDAEWGERLVAAIVAEDGADRAALSEQVEKLCRERLSGYKVPRDIEWMSQLPKSPYGKVLKRELRNRYWSGRDSVI